MYVADGKQNDKYEPIYQGGALSERTFVYHLFTPQISYPPSLQSPLAILSKNIRDTEYKVQGTIDSG